MELVLFDKQGKEIDWYDPIEETGISETETHLRLEHSNGYVYDIPKNAYSHYIIREKEN